MHGAAIPGYNPTSLRGWLDAAFRERGYELVSLSFCGPYTLEIFYRRIDTTEYWSTQTSIDPGVQWTHETRDREFLRVAVKDLDDHIHGVES